MSETIGVLGEEELKINTIDVQYEFSIPDNKKMIFDGLEYEEVAVIDHHLYFILILPELPEQVTQLFDYHLISRVARVPYSHVDWSFSKKIYQPGQFITNPNFYWTRIATDKVKLIVEGPKV